MKQTIYKYIILVITIIGLILFFILMINKTNRLNEKYKVAVNNEKAYNLELKKDSSRRIMYQFTINQLSYMNDSIIDKLNKVRKELNIKDKQLKQLQYNKTIITINDTIHLKDTIFKDTKFKLDTIISNKWYKLNLSLKYPNIINTGISINNEEYIIVSEKKETVNPPKKFFLLRWFQKKHRVIEVKVINNNPYVLNKESKFIQIIK